MYFGVNVVRCTVDSQYNMQSYCGHCHSCTRYYTIPWLKIRYAEEYGDRSGTISDNASTDDVGVVGISAGTIAGVVDAVVGF